MGSLLKNVGRSKIGEHYHKDRHTASTSGTSGMTGLQKQVLIKVIEVEQKYLMRIEML